jgi:hypothetical protein
MEMIYAIENMSLTLQIPDDSIAAEIARIDRPTIREGFLGSGVVFRVRPQRSSSGL